MRHQPDPPAPLFGHGLNYRAMCDAVGKPHPRELHRTSDPGTSQQAAHDMTESGDIGRMMTAALSLLQELPGSTSNELDAEWARRTNTQAQGAIRKRLNDLAKLSPSPVVRGDKRLCRVSGRPCHQWFPTPARAV